MGNARGDADAGGFHYCLVSDVEENELQQLAGWLADYKQGKIPPTAGNAARRYLPSGDGSTSMLATLPLCFAAARSRICRYVASASSGQALRYMSYFR